MRIYVIHDLKTLAIDPVAERIDAVVSGHSHKLVIAKNGEVTARIVELQA